jgi:hypothetical protein
MDSFVFTRHTSDCKFKRDRLCRRCNCPKWVEGRFNHERIRKSASTRLWEEAEQFRQKLEEALAKGLPLSSLHPDSPVSPECTARHSGRRRRSFPSPGFVKSAGKDRTTHVASRDPAPSQAEVESHN